MPGWFEPINSFDPNAVSKNDQVGTKPVRRVRSPRVLRGGARPAEGGLRGAWKFETLGSVHINMRTDYAVRALLEIASRSDQRGSVTRDEISEIQGIPRRYLATILNELRRAGLVSANRGPEGGYRLAKPAHLIALADVIRAVDGPLTQVGGIRPENLQYRGAAAKLGHIWLELRAAERHILESTSLHDLLADL
jgi:Rrf2 family protein